MTTLAEIASRFDNAKQTGPHQWEARCPVHDDRTASLCIGEGDDGKILGKCMANFGTAEVLAARGLGFPDLFPAANGHVGNGHHANGSKKKGTFDRAYDYRDENGRLLSQA